jgi:hypothetical protein
MVETPRISMLMKKPHRKVREDTASANDRASSRVMALAWCAVQWRKPACASFDFTICVIMPTS